MLDRSFKFNFERFSGASKAAHYPIKTGVDVKMGRNGQKHAPLHHYLLQQKTNEIILNRTLCKYLVFGSSCSWSGV